jgi:hypothetical protein
MAAMQSTGISQHLGSISPRTDNPHKKKLAEITQITD